MDVTTTVCKTIGIYRFTHIHFKMFFKTTVSYWEPHFNLDCNKYNFFLNNEKEWYDNDMIYWHGFMTDTLCDISWSDTLNGLYHINDMAYILLTSCVTSITYRNMSFVIKTNKVASWPTNDVNLYNVKYKNNFKRCFRA